MTSESDTLPSGGTDNAQPSTDIDNPSNWNFADPDDEQDNDKTPAPKGIEGEKAESAEGVQEAGESDEQETEEDAEETPEGEAKAPKDDVTVTLPDGSAVSLAEIKNGYLRQSDYTRKAQALANQRAEFEAVTTQQHHTMRAMNAFLQSTLPPRPDPNLAYSDPGMFVAQKAQYEQAVERLQQAQHFATSQEEAKNAIEMQKQAEKLALESDAMIHALPQLATQKGKVDFFNRINPVGELSRLSPQEIAGITDHRYLVVLDLAAEGLAARNAKQSAKAKVANVPPVVQPKNRAQNPEMVKNRDAMRKLSQTGSIEAAMLVNFD